MKAHLSIRSWQLHHSGTRGTKRSRVSQDSSISSQGSYRGPARGKSEIVESYMRSIRGVDAHVHSLPPASVTSSEISWLLDWIMTLNTSEVTISNFKRIHGQVLNFTIESILWWRVSTFSHFTGSQVQEIKQRCSDRHLQVNNHFRLQCTRQNMSRRESDNGHLCSCWLRNAGLKWRTPAP